MVQRAVEPRGEAERGVQFRRRGLIVGLGAAVAGLLAKASERVAQATDNSPLVVGQNNTATFTTQLTRTVASPNNGNTDDALVVSNNNGNAIVAHRTGFQDPAFTPFTIFADSSVSNSDVVRAFTNANGSVALSGRGTFAGVDGFAPAGFGVRGQSTSNTGVQGTSTSGTGVRGDSTNSTGVLGVSNPGVGVQGSSNGNVGVLGVSNSSVGVFASSTSSTGLYATSATGTGIVASTNGGNAIQGASNGNVGVLGTSISSIGGFFTSSTSTGLFASGPAAGFAARFDGPVQVNGSFTVIGGPKSAAVPHPDGSHRRLYCVESPESWFEDFGRDQLTNGRATVRLDRDFAVLVHSDNYDVFLTTYGDTKGLYVSSKGPTGFEVREVQGGTGSIGFSYRVVAKRKDIGGARLEKVDVAAVPSRPAAPHAAPAIPAIPPLPEPRPIRPRDRDGVPERGR
jgi:hypothetical protein